MDRKYNKFNIANARELRKNMTAEERHLWYDFLRDHPVKFRRQSVIGKYIVDFYCPSRKIIIELDGSQHYESNAIQKDAERTAYLNQYGLKIVRIQNTDVNINFEGVCEYIDILINQSPQSACADSSPFQREPF